MNAAEVSAVVSLASARTRDERFRALGMVVSSAQRIAPEMHAELMRLLNEARDASVHVLRPMAAEQNDRLRRLEPGPDPWLCASAKESVAEWVDGWLAIAKVRAAGLAGPGPMLLHGPPGTGKTMLTRALVRRLSMPAFVLEAHAIVQSHLGETGGNLTQAFAAMHTSGMLVVEELDALGGQRRTGGDAAQAEGNRITIALMRLVEESAYPVVLTTNRRDALDPALLRRCEYQIELVAPMASVRDGILHDLLGVLPPHALLDLPLPEAVALAQRAKRMAVVREVPVLDALARVLEVARG